MTIMKRAACDERLYAAMEEMVKHGILLRAPYDASKVILSGDFERAVVVKSIARVRERKKLHFRAIATAKDTSTVEMILRKMGRPMEKSEIAFCFQVITILRNNSAVSS